MATLDQLQGFLQVVTDRQQMTTANMANIDTPGYHTHDLDFRAAMQQVMNGTSAAQLQPASLEMDELPERPDGNNVNIDREGLMLSQTQLQFQLGVQLVKSQISEYLAVIKEA